MRQVSLIIGGNKGIGKSIYNTLKKRGDIIYQISRSQKKNKFSIPSDITTKLGLISIKKFLIIMTLTLLFQMKRIVLWGQEVEKFSNTSMVLN